MCVHVCVYVYMPLYVYSHMYMHGVQRLMSGVFFNHSPSYSLRQGLSLNLKLAVSAPQALGSECMLQHLTFLCGRWGSSTGTHVCMGKHFISRAPSLAPSP